MALLANNSRTASVQEILTGVTEAVVEALPGSVSRITLTEASSGQFAIAGTPLAARDRLYMDATPGVIHGPADEAAANGSPVEWKRGVSPQYDREFEDWAQAAHVDSGTIAPIVLLDKTVAGTVGIYWPWRVNRADPADIQRTMAWAVDLAAIALNQEHARALSPLIVERAELLARLNRGEAFPVVMEQICLAVERHVADTACAVILWEPGMMPGRLVMAPHVPNAYRDAVSEAYRSHRLPVGMALAQGHEVMTADIATDPLWEVLRDTALQSKIQAAFMCPITALDGQPAGAIACYFPHPYRLAERDKSIVRFFAQIVQVALAIDYARTVEQRWLAGLTHELRNQLGVMQLAAEMLKAAIDPLPMDEQSFAQINIDTLLDHLELQARLVDDILDICRLNLRQMRINREPVRLDRLVKSEADALAVRARSVGVHVRSDIAEDVWVMGDSDRLRQVLVNLTQNALKYTGSGGHIDVRLACIRNKAVLKIEDTGIGFDPALGSELFSVFVTGSQKPVHEIRTVNAGLGLALVRELVVQHGGAVSAASEGIGRGCLITVELPVAADQ